jgi:hypothetical protein
MGSRPYRRFLARRRSRIARLEVKKGGLSRVNRRSVRFWRDKG